MSGPNPGTRAFLIAFTPWLEAESRRYDAMTDEQALAEVTDPKWRELIFGEQCDPAVKPTA